MPIDPNIRPPVALRFMSFDLERSSDGGTPPPATPKPLVVRGTAPEGQRTASARADSKLPAGIEVAKNIAEIIAIVASGYWAYSHYFAGEAPSLEARAHLRTNVTWSAPDAGVCMARLRTVVKNIGKTSFDLHAIKLDVWLTTYQPASAVGVTRFNPEAIMNTKPTFTETLQGGSMTGHYAPDVELTDDYHFAVPIDSSSGVGEKLAVFKFSGTAVDSDGKPVPLTDWHWTGRCESGGTMQTLAPQAPQSTQIEQHPPD